MFCKYCGKEMPDGSAFCNECGKPLNETPKEGSCQVPSNGCSVPVAEAPSVVSASAQTKAPTASLPETSFLKKILKKVDEVGAKKICIQFSIALLVFFFASRLFGRLILTLLVTGVNGYLIYLQYAKTKKPDAAMIAGASAAFLLGILFSFI